MAFKSKIRFGREVTGAERAIIEDELLQAINDGRHDGNPVRENEGNVTLKNTIREWATLEDATAWVALMNTFTPPPLGAEAVTE